MSAALRIDQVDGIAVDPHQLGDAVRSQAARFIERFGAFDDARWTAPTRCTEWDAHTTFRHLADAVELHLTGFTGEDPPFVDDEPFNPQTTPDRWLAASAGESPSATLDRYEAAASKLADRIVDALDAGDDRIADGPYGEAHWSAITCHIMWDAWIHEGDILAGNGERAPMVDDLELQIVSMYGVLMTTVPMLRLGNMMQGVIRLEGDQPLVVRFGDAADHVSVRRVDDDTPADVWGTHVPVVDALAGRGDLASVLNGDAELVEALAFLGLVI